MNTQIPKIIANGKELKLEHIPDTTSTVTKFHDLIKLQPYEVVEIIEKSKYDDYIVEIKDLDEESTLKVYMPGRLRDNIYSGAIFVYNGKVPSKKAGYHYHNVSWFKQ